MVLAVHGLVRGFGCVSVSVRGPGDVHHMPDTGLPGHVHDHVRVAPGSMGKTPTASQQATNAAAGQAVQSLLDRDPDLDIHLRPRLHHYPH